MVAGFAFRFCPFCEELRPVEAFPASGPRCFDCREKSSKRKSRYDDAIMALVPEEGVSCDFYEMAELVGCTPAYLQYIAERALRKLRRRYPRLAAHLEDK